MRTFSDLVRLGSGDFTYRVPITSFPYTVLLRLYSLHFKPAHHLPFVLNFTKPTCKSLISRRRLTPSRTKSLNESTSIPTRPTLFISFSVETKPIPQPRARVRYSPHCAWGYTPNQKRLRAYKQLIALAYKQAARQKGVIGPQPFFGAAITLSFRKSARGDIDNYTKAILDALQGVAYPNDKFIKSLQVSLLEHTGKEGVLISLW